MVIDPITKTQGLGPEGRNLHWAQEHGPVHVMKILAQVRLANPSANRITQDRPAFNLQGATDLFDGVGCALLIGQFWV